MEILSAFGGKGGGGGGIERSYSGARERDMGLKGRILGHARETWG
ncbi:hypothetical protein COLO4_13772 [Corchorus olitorius]|uniref:Uncharacterized protein n=1 Tax=Corchorus olitorius TaxID=93759 RepID=A0A1R3JV95_9ROSI|nr:hypothetical protein COLO4_13772 [Corchorus olitorius]